MIDELSVLVSASCGGCAQALALARAFSHERPDVSVRVIDVDTADWSPPPQFAGTPMFYRGDTVVSYGNPTLQQLREAFEVIR